MRRVLFFLLMFSFVQGEPMSGYYRFPALSQNCIVFTAEGDLWKVPISGGVAQRLTTHHGVEYHASISPDGKTLAFSAQYEGPTEIYTMPIEGGLPKRLTYEGETALMLAWTPAGKILYTSEHYSTLPNRQLFTLDPVTTTVEPIPLFQASEGHFHPSGKTLFFTRLPFQGSHTKRYKGGTAQNLWKFTFGDSEAIPLTQQYSGTCKYPMFWEGRLYFVSDQDGTMNLWSMHENGTDWKQHTFHQGWDVKNPSLCQGRIVYQLGADLYLWEINAKDSQLIPITLASDFDQKREKWITSPLKYLTSVDFSPKGDRLLLTARGQVFVVPTQGGRIVEVTRKNGVRYRSAKFLGEGKSIVVLSDETEELEFWKFPANGVGSGELLTTDGEVFRDAGVPSPDGKWIAFTDKNWKLWLFQIEEKRMILVETGEYDTFESLRWSPDSQWLAYVSYAENLFAQIKIYQLETGQKRFLTSDRVDSYGPAWSSDGKWFYFLSDRVFQSVVSSPWGPRQPEPFFDKTTKIYAVALKKEERFPFLPPDELHEDKKEEEKKDDKEEKKDATPLKLQIDWDGIQHRVYEVPLPAGRYQELTVAPKTLFWTEREVGIDTPKNLMSLEIQNKEVKSKTVAKEIKGYDLSVDGKKIVVQKENQFYVFNVDQKPEDLEKHKVEIKNWMFSLQPREEWRQIFIEAWRLERDYFYDPKIHGLSWKEVLAKYLPLVHRVADRDELADLIAQMVSELSALHIFVTGGDRRRGDEDIALASLGAVLMKDDSAGGYRIQHIYQSEPDYLETISPLAKSEVLIQEGDILESINGVSLLTVPHPSILLRNQVGKQVLLKVKSKASQESFYTVVTPISSKDARNLRYSEWEYTRRLYTEEKSHGQIGYVHLRAMGGDTYTEWVRHFYPVFHRQGLIVDVRHNQGGNTDSWILEKLLRKAWFYWKPRVGKPFWNMQYAFRGHLVVLCNEWTASDGEAFAEGVRRLNLGKIIGTRTWGGEIWLSFNNWLVDKGIASAAEIGVYGPEGKWLIEGHGVDPDIVVDNFPHSSYQGKDAQLDAALHYLQTKIKEEPRLVPQHPEYPDKSK